MILMPHGVRAQLSPGKLAQPHEHLEGLKQCGKCHKLGSKNLTPKCLDCHGEIKAQVEKGKGLHSGDDFKRCVDCHVDHQGRDFQMIHWPEGMAGFDHERTGHSLVGAHQKQECRTCHSAKFILEPEPLKEAGKKLDRTFLGLGTECLSCHKDIHQQQFTADCTTCHNQDHWQPAPGFSHESSAFPLTGKHQQVECAKCHRSEPAGVRYRPVSHQACTDCHTDHHQPSQGENCARCHNTSGWLNITADGFDHRLTRYPLEGKHAAVACASCHTASGKKLAFDRCDRCHADTHQAGWLQRPRLMQCEKCHTVEGFQPAEFGIQDHAETSFALEGAHRAVPCLLCHVQGNTKPVWKMARAHQACTDCHNDPHEGGMSDQAQGRGCVACHSLKTWRGAEFDHAATAFPLIGAHQRVNCAGCHAAKEYRLGKTQCAQCHQDPHRGQFASRVLDDGTTINCAACHDTQDWLAQRFNHEADSRFPLRGGHSRVACTACHQPQDAATPQLLHYKPIAVECIACHTDSPDLKEDKNE